MKSGKVCIALLLALVTVALGVVTPARAATGTVQVTVYDNKTKETIIGATVTLSDANKQWPDQNAITNENGVATFPLVQPGSSYVVTVTMVGYSKYSKRDIRVVGGVTNPIKLPLLPDLVEQVVVKGREKTVELDQDSQSKTKITADAFEDLPVFGRDYQAALSLAPGVQDSNNDGNPNVNGSRERDFKMSLDGVSNVDPLTGKYMSNVNPDAIEEMEIVTSGADASWGGAVGGFGRIITKSGNNKYETSLKMYVADGMFTGDGAGRYYPDPTTYQTRQPSFTISGPILRDKLWFVLDHEWVKQTVPILLLGGKSYPQEYNATRNHDKLTWQVTPKNKLQLQYTSDPQEVEPAGVDSVTARDSGFKATYGGPTTLLKWTAPFSPSFFWEGTVGFSDVKLTRASVNPSFQNDCVSRTPQEYPGDPNGNPWYVLANYQCEDRSNNGRTTGAYFQDYSDVRQRWTYALDAQQFVERWLGGSHNIKFGAQIERVNYERDITRRPFETLTFNVGSTYKSPYRYILDSQSYYFPGQGANTLNTLGLPQRGVDNSRGNYMAFYLTDTFEPRQNLSISAGLRLSREELTSDGYKPTDPLTERAGYDAAFTACIEQYGVGAAKACAARAYNALTLHPTDDPALLEEIGAPETCQYAVNPGLCDRLLIAQGGGPLKFRERQRFDIVNNNLAPTFKIRWDPRNDSKTIVSASLGRYYGDTILEPLVYENGPDFNLQRYGLNEEGIPTGDQTAPLPTSTVPSTMSIRVIDRNLARAYNDEFTIQLEREVAPETTVRIGYIQRKYSAQLQQRDVNHEQITDYDVEHRNTGLMPICNKLPNGWDCTGITSSGFTDGTNPSEGPPLTESPDGLPDLKPINPAFNNIYEIGNYNKSKYRGVELAVNRRFFQNWELSASYVYSKSEGDAEDFIGSLQSTNTADAVSGLLSTDQPHVLKVNGRVKLPWLGGFTLGGNATYESGLPYSKVEFRDVIDFPTDLTGGVVDPALATTARYITRRIIFVDNQRNNFRNPPMWTFNVNAQKDFSIKSVQATLEVKVYNLLNDDTQEIAYMQHVLDAVIGATGRRIYHDVPVGGPRFGRFFELGLKLKF